MWQGGIYLLTFLKLSKQKVLIKVLSGFDMPNKVFEVAMISDFLFIRASILLAFPYYCIYHAFRYQQSIVPSAYRK